MNFQILTPVPSTCVSTISDHDLAEAMASLEVEITCNNASPALFDRLMRLEEIAAARHGHDL